MMYGELKQQSEAYQNGHSTGSVRAYDDAIMHFEQLSKDKHKKMTPEEVVKELRICKANWLDHCDTFGMGVEQTEE